MAFLAAKRYQHEGATLAHLPAGTGRNTHDDRYSPQVLVARGWPAQRTRASVNGRTRWSAARRGGPTRCSASANPPTLGRAGGRGQGCSSSCAPRSDNLDHALALCPHCDRPPAPSGSAPPR
eukprot:7828106-Pyramimonas_sp.AAC.1